MSKIMDTHYKKLLTNSNQESIEKTRNCRIKEKCLLENNFSVKNVVYKDKIYPKER